MKNTRFTYARTCVYNINYHIIWCIKYRNKVLSPEIANVMKTILEDISAENGFTLVDAQVGENDHVHCFVSAPPKLSVTFIVKHLKGTSAIRLFRYFPELRQRLWNHQLWSPSYFVETVGSTSQENILRYISMQDNPEKR